MNGLSFYFSSFNSLNKTDLNNDSKMLNISAVKNPLTAKPVMSFPANNMIHALMTNRNSPNDKIVTGSVNNTNNGRTNIFKIDIVNATKTAVT